MTVTNYTARRPTDQQFLDEMMACCSAIWLKEEARELGAIERLGDFLDLPEKNDSTVVPGAMQERRSQVLASILQDPLADYSPPGRQAAPARLTDIPFVQNATDVACFITRAFKRRNVRVEFLAEVVPDFYRVRSMDNGLRPQRYLAGITAILAETLPDGALLLVDVEPDRFVFDCRALGGNCYLTERTFCVGDGNGQLTVDSDLLMACYTLWADHDLTLNPLAFSVPVAAAESVRRKITAERLHQVRRLFQAKPELRWKALADDKLDEVARLAARANVSDDLVWVSLPALNEDVQLVSLPAVFRTLGEPNGGKELRKVFH